MIRSPRLDEPGCILARGLVISLDCECGLAEDLGIIGLGDLDVLGSRFAEYDTTQEGVRPVIGRREGVRLGSEIRQTGGLWRRRTDVEAGIHRWGEGRPGIGGAR